MTSFLIALYVVALIGIVWGIRDACRQTIYKRDPSTFRVDKDGTVRKVGKQVRPGIK